MRTRLEWGWEKLDATTSRAMVFGGWIIHHTISDGTNSKPITRSEAMTFVPDRDHQWSILIPVSEEEKNKVKNTVSDFVSIREVK